MQTIAYYEDVIFYKGVFYTNKENIKIVSLHNRINVPYSPSDIRELNNMDAIQSYDKGILLLDGFHNNMGHLLWDFMYPSYYGLLFHKEEKSDIDFQWMTSDNMYKKYGNGWHLDIVEQFSGNKVITPDVLSGLCETPLKIPYLIAGIGPIGIGNVRNDFCVSRQLKQHMNDPIESFVNRMYLRYNIKRNTFMTKEGPDLPINIGYIINKRPHNNIKPLFGKLRKKYSNMCNFAIIDWSKYNFKQQLSIINAARIIICGVGTARTMTPFLPNGAMEIQTNAHCLNGANNVCYFDYHIGTLSKYVMVININHYTIEECKNKSCSQELERIIDHSIQMRNDVNCPIKLDDNIPPCILNLKVNVNETAFLKWRSSLSNDIGDLINIMNSNKKHKI